MSTAANPSRRSTSDLVGPLVGLLLLLVVAVPLFLRMPLTNDAELFDLQASAVRQGGVLYRDFLEPNLPGVVWLHLLARSTFGESSEGLRVFDLLIWSGTLAAVGLVLRLAGGSARVVGWTLFGLAACYLSQSEWCHCQRDGWMLLPVCTALILRVRFTLSAQRAPLRWGLAWACLEGVCWGLAVWLKPHVVIPGIAVILVSGYWSTNRLRWGQELLMVLMGGLLMGAAGVGWLWQSGCWPYFLETLRDWNPDYFAAGRTHWSFSRLVAIVWRLSPWSLLPVIALAQWATWCRDRWHEPRTTGQQESQQPPSPSAVVISLVGVMFLGWMGQVFFLQHQFDYVCLPIVILAMFLLAALATASTATSNRVQPVGWLVFAVMVLSTSPLTSRDRLAAWTESVMGPNSPALKDRLALLHHPQQRHLSEIADFLRTQDVTSRDVCCYNSDCVSLYRQLSLLPPVKYTYFFETLQFFPERRQQVLTEIERQPHRFVVTDLLSCGLSSAEALEIGPEGPLAPPPAYRDAPRDIYPWNCRVVYRAGTYLVHQVRAEHEAQARVVLAP